MFKALCVVRCALSATQMYLSENRNSFGDSVSSVSRSDDLAGSSSSLTQAERVRAIESLSNEVFGCGNKHLKNVETLTALPEGLHSFPEVCFIGKPNCGKSSLISCLLHNARLAKAGATGGTTRLLQFFNVGDGLLLVDTPGYGGWKGRQLDQPLVERANAFSILFRYLALRNGSNLKRVYWLIEASARTPIVFQPRDEEILAFLTRERIPFSVILTKIDRHWRLYADQQRRTAVVGKDGVLHRGHFAPKGGPELRTPLPDEGVARNVREVFDFLGTDSVPVLGVSANRKQPGRSRNIELVQHDIVHYCTTDLLPGEALSLTNLRKLSYAPPTADRIQEVQLRYPVESFVVPADNNLSLARMVEHHEAMKARFLKRNVEATRLTTRDVVTCHLGCIDAAAQKFASEELQRARLGGVISVSTFLETPSNSANASTGGKNNALMLPVEATKSASDKNGHNSVSACHNSDVVGPAMKGRLSVTTTETTRLFHTRPSLSAKRLSPSPQEEEWRGLLEGMWEPESLLSSPCMNSGKDMKPIEVHDAYQAENLSVSLDGRTNFVSGTEATQKGTVAVSDRARGEKVFLLNRIPSSPPLPALIDPNTHYVMAVDGTGIPRSMVSVSVEQLAVEKEDELAHFATKSGAGAYEELLLLDRGGDTAAADPFTESNDFARLPEAVQIELLDTKRYRTRSAARKQEERFLAKYVEKKRKERSVSLQAEGYMCPWLGVSEKREVVRGLGGSYAFGRSGAVIRGLKQTGFGGKSYSARTMKNRGRATKKTGSWAA